MLDKQYYQEKLNKRYPNESLLLREFRGYKQACSIECISCGEVYRFQRLSDALKNSKKFCCKKCGKQKYLLKKFSQSLSDRFKGELFQIISFTNTQEPLDIVCGTCGEHIHFEVADSIKNRKHICRNCFPFREVDIINTRTVFLDYINNSSEWELVQSLDNVHALDLVSCRCLACGKINKKNMYDYLRGIQCNCKRRTNVRERILNILGEDYTILEGGETVESRVLVKHSCGFVYSVSCQSILQGGGICPKCKKEHSRGERRIQHFLDNMNLDYYYEYPKELEGHILRFDFYIPSKDKYIEYQGRQHYMPVEYFGGKETFERQKQYDQIKRKYCKEHLIEISYKDFENIESILAYEFND